MLQIVDWSTLTVSDPCLFTLTRGTPPLAAITGATDGCTGASLTLCGPDSATGYAWSGPGGFQGATRCVEVRDAGDYALVVGDAVSGCLSDPTTVTVTFRDCTAPAAPPNCPRTAYWWSRICAGADPALDDAARARIAACVGDHAAVFAWGGDPAGLCRTMRPHREDLRSRALRQFAAVVADVCAPVAALPAAVGAVGLDPATPLDAPATGTVGDWIAATDARLVSLATRHGHGASEAYREIIRQAWAIAHGRGIGAVCADDSIPLRPGLGHALAPDDVLADELRDTGDGAVGRIELAQNPARGAVRFSLAMDAPGSEVVVGVYDLTGRRVRELAHGPYPAGVYPLSWDGRDADGTPMANGVYFLQLRIDGVRTQSRLTLLR